MTVEEEERKASLERGRTLQESQMKLLKALGLEEFNGLDGNWVTKVHLIIEANEFTRVEVEYNAGPRSQHDIADLCTEFVLLPKALVPKGTDSDD